jgi:hypothetical protein
MSRLERQPYLYGKPVLKFRKVTFMIWPIRLVKYFQKSALAVLVVLAAVSCQPVSGTLIPTPVLQTVELTRDGTFEVTRINAVPVPVTETPSLTLTVSQTPSLTSTPTYPPTDTPTITPTLDPPVITILVHAACNFGPGGAYLWNYGLLETSWMEVIGRNQDGSWLYVQGVHGWNPCWVKAEFVHFNAGGDVSNYNIPIVTPPLIYSNLYRPPDGVQAFRSGNKVTIYWNAVWMTADDYEGYLIEAWLCQEGRLVFRPINYKPDISQNIGTVGMIVNDEAGCLEPSSARIYTAEKHGYTGYIVIPWPPNQSAPSPTP